MPRWQNHVGALMPRFLRDHRVDGTVVFPASGYVELMLAAARETLGEMPWEIESIVFHDALVLSQDSLTVIETSIDPTRGSIEIASRPRASQAHRFAERALQLARPLGLTDVIAGTARARAQNASGLITDHRGGRR